MPDLAKILTDEVLTVEGLFYRLLADEVEETFSRATRRRPERAEEEHS